MKVIAGVMLTMLLGVMYASVFHLSANMHEGMGMTDCPFMMHGEALCPMNLADHLGAWQSMFQAITPLLVFLIVGVGAVVVATTLAPHLVLPRWREVYVSLSRLREQTYTFSYRPLQDLFADGILHPKVF